MEKLIKEVEDLIESSLKNNKVVEILPQMRTILERHKEALYTMSDKLLDEDFPMQAFNGQVPGIQTIAWEINGRLEVEPSTGEPDIILVRVDLSERLRARNLIQTIHLYDCTGCCNALKFAKLVPDHVLVLGNIGRTYHS